jgi:DNA-binding transcriptional ArsR family regulator
VLRIHFTPDDLVRTRLVPNADRHWETALSLNLLQSSQTPKALTSWRSWARRRLGTWAAPLLSVAPLAEHFAHFRELLAKEEYAELASTLERYQAEVVEPTWPAISAAVSMDRARRTRSLLEHGLEGLLGTLTPLFRWRAPVLEMDRPLEQDLHLGGRGLVLVPSYFCSRRPIVVAEPARPAVLIHPIGPEARVLVKIDRIQERRPHGIDALMGSTRAAVLQALSDGCTTTELAERVGVSAASASEHATILRQAGLISTQRRGPSVLHVVTELGSAVLNIN